MLRDCLDYYCARGLTRTFPCSGNTPTTVTFPTITVLSKCYDHCCARGLSQPLFGVCSPRLHVIGTHIQLRDISLDLATRLILRLPASSGTTSVRCTCRCILFLFVQQLGSQLNWEFFLDPGTMCLRHLLPGSRTKWAHFTLR